MMTLTIQFPASGYIFPGRLIVKAEYRNRGIGGIITSYLIDYAKRLGYEEISEGFTNVILEGEDEYGKYVKLLRKL